MKAVHLCTAKKAQRQCRRRRWHSLNEGRASLHGEAIGLGFEFEHTAMPQ